MIGFLFKPVLGLVLRPSAVELRILTLLFDPAALARREQSTQPTKP